MAHPKHVLPPYGADLSFVHDAGFGGLAAAAAGELLQSLRKQDVAARKIVDLGCGSGILAGALADAGYDVLGYDLSADMLALARKRAPRADFRQDSCLTARLPSCVAVTAMGEVFNYLFDDRHSDQGVWKLFERVFAALAPGGLFMFDVAGPGRGGAQGTTRNFSEGDGWACLFSAQEDRRRRLLVRDIVTFRQAGARYRRAREIHRLRLYPARTVRLALRAAGFRVRTLGGYGPVRFPRGWVGFLARKP